MSDIQALIQRLRGPIGSSWRSANEAADALESQAKQIEELTKDAQILDFMIAGQSFRYQGEKFFVEGAGRGFPFVFDSVSKNVAYDGNSKITLRNCIYAAMQAEEGRQ